MSADDSVIYPPHVGHAHFPGVLRSAAPLYQLQALSRSCTRVPSKARLCVGARHEGSWQALHLTGRSLLAQDGAMAALGRLAAKDEAADMVRLILLSLILLRVILLMVAPDTAGGGC